MDSRIAMTCYCLLHQLSWSAHCITLSSMGWTNALHHALRLRSEQREVWPPLECATKQRESRVSVSELPPSMAVLPIIFRMNYGLRVASSDYIGMALLSEANPGFESQQWGMAHGMCSRLGRCGLIKFSRLFSQFFKDLSSETGSMCSQSCHLEAGLGRPA